LWPCPVPAGAWGGTGRSEEDTAVAVDLTAVEAAVVVDAVPAGAWGDTGGLEEDAVVTVDLAVVVDAVSAGAWGGTGGSEGVSQFWLFRAGVVPRSGVFVSDFSPPVGSLKSMLFSRPILSTTY
jgi:hypothetical protein